MVDKSLLLTLKMQDNYSAGISSVLVGGALEMKHSPYVNVDGEFKEIEIDFYGAFDANYNNDIVEVRQLPIVSTQLLLDFLPVKMFSTGELNRYKDNREITTETIQFKFENAENVIIGDLFFPFISQNEQNGLKFYYSTDENVKYTSADKKAKGTLGGNASFARDLAIGRVLVNNVIEIAGIKSWAIADSDRNLCVGVNNSTASLYLGF